MILGYADQVAGRLRRIAAARSTGMLPFAALAAATLAVARRATLATECGTFREAVARGSDGYLKDL